MDRRGFFGLIAGAAAVCTGIVSSIRHRLRGDGVSDETQALQALINGEPVEMPDGSIQEIRSGVIRVPRGVYRVGAPLQFTRSAGPTSKAVVG